MDIRTFYDLIKQLENCEKSKNTFLNKIKKWRIERKISKCIMKAAEKYSDYAYEHMYDLFYDILDSNLQK